MGLGKPTAVDADPACRISSQCGAPVRQPGRLCVAPRAGPPEARGRAGREAGHDITIQSRLQRPHLLVRVRHGYDCNFPLSMLLWLARSLTCCSGVAPVRVRVARLRAMRWSLSIARTPLGKVRSWNIIGTLRRMQKYRTVPTSAIHFVMPTLRCSQSVTLACCASSTKMRVWKGVLGAPGSRCAQG